MRRGCRLQDIGAVQGQSGSRQHVVAHRCRGVSIRVFDKIDNIGKYKHAFEMTQKQVASIACQYSKNECSVFLLHFWLDYHLYFDFDYHLNLDPYNTSPR